MLSIKKLDTKNENNEKYVLISNGEFLVNDIHIFQSVGSYYVSIREDELSMRIAKEVLRDLPIGISRLSLYLPIDNLEFVDDTEINRIGDERNCFNVAFKFTFDFENWKNPWSIVEYGEAMKKIVSESEFKDIEWEQDDEEIITNGCHLIFKVDDIDKEILSLIEEKRYILLEIHNRVILFLLTQSRSNSLISYFKFPLSIQTACEQYLIYFVRFLHDLGIEASANIKHEAGQVLFSVTPSNEHDALDTIHQALELYLQLPTNPTIKNYIQVPNDPKIQQLIANIHHLQGQLMLANATLEMKDQTIRNQEFYLEQQRLINTTILQDSLRFIATSKESEDKESILGGTVSLKKYEGKGFEVDIPQIFRIIKEILGKA